jgi:hypothetical protein
MSISFNINKDNFFFKEDNRKSPIVVLVSSVISFSEHRVDYQYILLGYCFSVYHYLLEVFSFDGKNIKWFPKVITPYEAIQKGRR